MSIDAAACVIDAVGTAPPRNPASCGAVGQQVDRSLLRRVERQEVVVGEAVRGKQRSDEVFEAGSRRTDRHPSAAQVIQGLDAGPRGGDEQRHVRCQRHDRLCRIRLIPTLGATHRKVGDCRVRQGEVQLPARQSSDVFLGPARRLRGDVESLGGAELVRHLGQGAADHEEGATGWGGADAQERPGAGSVAGWTTTAAGCD